MEICFRCLSRFMEALQSRFMEARLITTLFVTFVSTSIGNRNVLLPIQTFFYHLTQFDTHILFGKEQQQKHHCKRWWKGGRPCNMYVCLHVPCLIGITHTKHIHAHGHPRILTYTASLTVYTNTLYSIPVSCTIRRAALFDSVYIVHCTA